MFVDKDVDEFAAKSMQFVALDILCKMIIRSMISSMQLAIVCSILVTN